MPRRLGIAGRGRRSGVRHGHHQVGVRGCLARQHLAHPAPRLVQVAAEHVRVRSREVDELEHAQPFRALGEPDGSRTASLTQDHDLAGLDVPQEFGAQDVKRRRLRCEHPATPTRSACLLRALVVPGKRRGRHLRVTGRGRDRVRDDRVDRQPAQDERPEPMGVAYADDPALVHEDQGIRTLYPGQQAHESLDQVGPRLIGEQRGEHLGIGRADEAAAPTRQLRQQHPGVHEVAVVTHRDGPAGTQAEGGLAVLPERGVRWSSTGNARWPDRPGTTRCAPRRAPVTRVPGPCRPSPHRGG